MKTLLLITTALVAVGAGPVFAAGAKSMQRSDVTMQNSGSMTSSARMTRAVDADGRTITGSRAQMDARERPVTQQLNLEAQAAAGAPGATGNSQTGMMSGTVPSGAATGGAFGRPEGAQGASAAPLYGAPARGETPNSPTSTGAGTTPARP